MLMSSCSTSNLIRGSIILIYGTEQGDLSPCTADHPGGAERPRHTNSSHITPDLSLRSEEQRSQVLSVHSGEC